MATPARTRSWRDLITPWRVGYTVVLAAAALLLIIGFQASKDQRAANCSIGPIVRLLPCPGDSDLRQGLIGANLTGGYQAALLVDNVEIPQDQLRTGGQNQVYFQPGAGTQTGALTPGTHSATVVFWPLTGTRDHDGKTFTWQFGVT